MARHGHDPADLAEGDPDLANLQRRPQTTVDFDQIGAAIRLMAKDWIALNRIIDPSGLPSQILGQIKAEGSVYLINANGIIFGGASQVNVHTLIASSLSFLSDTITSSTPPGSIAYDNAVSASNATFLNSTAGGIASPEATGQRAIPAQQAANPAVSPLAPFSA